MPDSEGSRPLLTSLSERERVRRMRIRLAALKRHQAARGPDGRSTLAVSAGQRGAATRQGDSVWGLALALKRWHGVS